MQRQQVERPIPRSKPAGLPARPVGQGARILTAACVTLARRQDARRVRARLAPRGTGRRIAQRTPRALLCVPAERCCAPTSQRRARVAPRRRFDRARLHAAHQERTVHRTALSAAALAIHEHYDDAAEHDGQRRRDAALQRCRLSRAARHASLRHGCSPAARASALHAAAAREAACSPARHAPLPRAATARAKRRTTPGSPAQQGAGGRGWADHRELYRRTAHACRAAVRTRRVPRLVPAWAIARITRRCCGGGARRRWLGGRKRTRRTVGGTAPLACRRAMSSAKPARLRSPRREPNACAP